MFDLAPIDLLSPNPPSVPWTAERYLEVLHPRDGRGVVGGLTFRGSHVHSFTLSRDILSAAASTLTEQEAYVALNSYHGPRGGERRLAGLNAVWLDLDTYRVPALAELDRREVADRILSAISGAGLPTPSLLVDSGRGFYSVWLLSGAVPAALPRWRAVMRALTKWAKPLGADAACVDPARVLRLPGSWHEGASRRVAIVSGDGARHAFEPLADAIWHAAGRPSRRDFDATRSTRRRQDRPEGCGAVQHPRGLPRRAFWAAIQRDLDMLLDRWGGVIPQGMRDIWLHLYCCALTWDEAGADVLDTILERAARATPGLTPREVARMMGPTIRRGLAAVAGQPRGCDPRYDYASDRMCEMLSLDRRIALELGLRQLLPADLRAERNRQRRTERRRAEGAMPRPIWLAAHPISRLKPWEAEGISRATWYRRQADARQRRLRACIDSMMAGAADVCGLGETGAVPLYKGEAPAASGADGTYGEKQDPTIANPHSNPEAREKTTRAATPQWATAGSGDVTGTRAANPSPAETTTEPTVPDQPAIDFEVLKAAAERLSHAELGALTRVALVLDRGPAHRRELGRRAQVPPDLLDALDAWLRVTPDAAMVTGLVGPGIAPRRSRSPRQGLLFDAATVPPAPAREGNSGSLRAATIAAGVRVLGRAGIGEQLARSFLGKQLQQFGFGVVAEAIDALEPKLDTIAEPRAWITAFARRHVGGATKGASDSRSASATPGHRSTGTPPPAEKTRPLATPEFLGISPAGAKLIREQNRRLEEETRARFGRIRERK